ncbi:sensor histidine kinase [Micromonospora peucetia]|uniref:histidine kinase n=1 Tax=Micromonospora peucetia TaxID=47871 RepID=A0A1C6VS48_9ACTN|nr:nitrate- and nitrite sensing domain-containing protein [Micromonospora peucetia]WSA30990.1 nitrate- and nitrite sensing domain-containing protein [Micromonospora peucetia]SCL69151.1 Signal transduction histidine kinase [Micromonospora peucetia]
MGSRSSNLRRKVVALLASLVALWAFAAWVTLREGVSLLWVQVLDTQVAQPGEQLLLELQAERRATAAYLGGSGAAEREQLDAQWRRTEGVADNFRNSVSSWRVDLAAEESQRRVDTVVAGLDRLAGVRESIRDRQVDRAAATQTYTELIDSVLRMYGSLGNLDDERFTQETAALIQLVRIRELMSQEDALVTGALAAGRMTPEETATFARAAGAQRYLDSQVRTDLFSADRVRYEALLGGEAYTGFRALEDRVVLQGRTGDAPPVSAADWRASADVVLEEQQSFIIEAGDALVERAVPIAVGVVLRLVLAAGLGLLAVIASIVVSITTARALVQQLERLREAAIRLANERLPGVVERLGHGEEVDVAKEAPPLEFGDDEIGQVGKAFNAVQETAIRTAVEQADLRRNVREVFLSLARRTQALVHRQLTLLDAMERREHDAEELEDLFRVDHLATRMRRNAENLIVLSGSTPGRAWRRNVPMVDVVRGAVAEVEDYTRVNVLPLGAVSLTGRAVGDVIHLLAELIENGLSFSPPHTSVEVRGQLVANGFAIEIEDRGLGMSEEDLAAANHRIVDQSELNLANASRLGLYVVSRLTERHGVRVQLKESAYGGTTAVVLIPAELVTAEDEDPSTSGGFPAGLPAGLPVAGASGQTPPAAEPPLATVALAEPLPAPRLPSAPDSVAPAEEDALPTRSRGRSLPTPAPALDTRLPTRPRGGSEQYALDGPTFPTGLPVTSPRSLPAEAPDATDLSAATGGQIARPDEADTPAGAPAPPQTGPGPTATGGPAPTAREVTARTGAGLPVRVRQASIVPELRDDPATADDSDGDEDVARPPEQVRRMMSSYQTGTRRGRTDAARLLGATGDSRTETGEGTDAGDDLQAT